MRTGPADTDIVQEPLGDKLKTFFDEVSCHCMPDRLAELAAALEAALEQGELQCGRSAPGTQS